MFPILTTDSLLQTLGLGTLSDAISCEVEEERNGIYELTLEYPQGGAHASDIALNALIVAKPNFTDAPQPFRIYAIKKEISGKIEVHAQHISYDLGGVIVSPKTMTGATCKQAGDYLVTGTNFTFKTDKTNSADFKIDVPSSARSWLGGKSGSLLSVYGTGEYHYDGYEIEFNLHRGMNRGVQLRYGKNLTELESEVDCSNLASSVVCYYEDNGSVTMGTPVSTGLTGITRELALDVSDDYNSPPSVATLTARASTYIANHNLTVPKTNITLDFVQASKLKDRVDLCDTVSIYYDALDVSATAKCIRTVWDVLAERYTETEFGDAKNNISDTIIEVEKVAADAVTKTMMEQAVDDATDFIKHGEGYMRFIYNASDELTEIVSLDDPDITQAQSVWRWNNGGFGHSSTGYNGPYTLAITQNGAIVADFITAGTLNANVIRAGILQDAAGKNSWNLETGAFTITNGSINITTTDGSYDLIRFRYNGSTSTMETLMASTMLSSRNITTGESTNIVGGYLDQRTNDGTTFSVSADGDLRLWQASNNISTTRQRMNNKGKLWQYDANGKLRTYLEYGDIFLYTASETQTVKLSGAAFPALGGSVQLYDTSAVERTRLTANGLNFYNASGTQTGYYPTNVNLSELVYLKKYDFNGVSISAGTAGTRAAQQSKSVYKSGYRPIVARLSYVSDSSLANVVPFFGGGDESGLYVNFYRASGSSGTINATVIVAFIRTEVTGVSR